MTPEQIVRALAAADPLDDVYGVCWHCRSVDHDVACPWRLAVEWVAAPEGARMFEVHRCEVMGHDMATFDYLTRSCGTCQPRDGRAADQARAGERQGRSQ